MGSERSEEINDSEVEAHKELSYKRFQRGDYKVRADSSNGGFRCPFCASEDEDGYTYFHLLQHAVYIAEDSKSGKQRAKHSAMAKYLAVDLDYEVKQYSDSDSDSDSVPLMKRYRSATSKREKEALNKAELERKMNEMREEMNALITKLQRAHTELMKEKGVGVNNNSGGTSTGTGTGIGIKKIGEIDANVFRRACMKRLPVPAEEAEMRGFELCSLWQTKLNSSLYRFLTVRDNKSVVNEGDASLVGLKKELGEEAYNAVVTCIKDLHKYNTSRCPKNYEVWNFKENRKAKLEEVISWLRSGRKDQVELKYILVSIK